MRKTGFTSAEAALEYAEGYQDGLKSAASTKLAHAIEDRDALFAGNTSLNKRVAALQAENKALREALEPFAFLAKYIDARSHQKPDYEIASVSMRNLRSARAALHKEKAQ